MVLICNAVAIRRKSYFFLGARIGVVLDLECSIVFLTENQCSIEGPKMAQPTMGDIAE
jgi:hypothetical protein